MLCVCLDRFQDVFMYGVRHLVRASFHRLVFERGVEVPISSGLQETLNLSC
jgi:hypothetical protein